MKKEKFNNNETYLPVTMQQWEDLTNEMLSAINRVASPQFLNADYAAQVLMSAIHALDHSKGIISKQELFESCINRISCHVTYHSVQEIQARMKRDGDTSLNTVEGGATAPEPVPDEPA